MVPRADYGMAVQAGPDEVWVNDGWELGNVRTFVFNGEDLDFGGPTSPNILSWEENLVPDFNIGDSWATPGDTVLIDFSFSSGDPLFSMNAYEVIFSDINTSQIQFIGIDSSNSLTGEANWLVSTNSQNDQILVAAAGSAPITESGSLFSLKFAVNQNFQNAEDGTHEISLQSFIVNEISVYNEQDSVSGNIYIADCNANYVTFTAIMVHIRARFHGHFIIVAVILCLVEEHLFI